MGSVDEGFRRDPRRRLTVDQAADQDTDQSDESSALISQLRDEIAYLRDENRRKDELLATALSRIPPQLEAPREARESPETDAAGRPGTPGSPEPQTPAELRPWWRRVFGG
jgi:hypothetical protein